MFKHPPPEGRLHGFGSLAAVNGADVSTCVDTCLHSSGTDAEGHSGQSQSQSGLCSVFNGTDKEAVKGLRDRGV